MKRFFTRTLAPAAFAAISTACSHYADVGVTTSESLVAGCQKVADVSVKDSVPPQQVKTALSDAARAKGANYVVVASEDAHAGAAYRCEGKPVASR
jgi:hypothetical protein